jgi:hypothetical protein
MRPKSPTYLWAWIAFALSAACLMGALGIAY